MKIKDLKNYISKEQIDVQNLFKNVDESKMNIYGIIDFQLFTEITLSPMLIVDKGYSSNKIVGYDEINKFLMQFQK